MDIFEKNEEQCRIFCYNVRAWRKRSALTRREMAALLHISRREPARLERGEIEESIPVDIHIRLHRLFGVTSSEQFMRLF